jgi:hypothetical protein
MMDLDIADRLRAAGLPVLEVDGWQQRSAGSFDPRGSVDHHTAGPAAGNAPSLEVCIYGRSDLPGPLCNVLIGRDNTCFVIAAGRANHAGSGGWRGLSGNSSVYGIERENVGTQAEPWRPDQNDAAARAHAALIAGRAGADMVCRHAEWAPDRKPDTHDIAGDDLRRWVANAGTGPVVDELTGGIDVLLYIRNPNRPEEIWATDGMYKRWVSSMDEVDVMRFAASAQGVAQVVEGSMGATEVSMDCWASIPVAPGTEWHP